MCRDGEVGIRGRLKICFPKGIVGSSPTPGTRYFMQHVISAKQFLTRGDIDALLGLAEQLERDDVAGKVTNVLHNKILACIFYEPSTRTRLSFSSAMLKLGGKVLTAESAANFSSATKGETLEDSIKIISGYCNAIVLRHPEAGSADRAAAVSSVPVINAGDSAGEHPTQALLDLYTIKKELGRLDGLKITLVGDLLYSRTLHSLLQLLPFYQNIELFCVSPDELRLPEKYTSLLKDKGVRFTELKDWKDILSQSDVVYMTRVQKERFASMDLYNAVKDAYVFDDQALSMLKSPSAILHPLPRVNEIATTVDNDPRAAYFRQARNGLYVRMAILQQLLINL